MWRPRRETRPSWRRGKPVKTRAGASRASAGASAVFPGLCRPRENARGGSAGDHVCAAPDRGHLGQDRYGDFLRSDGADLHADRGVDPPETLPGNPFLGELRKNAAHLSGRPDQTDVFRGGRRVGKPRAQSRQVGLPATRHNRHVTVAPRPQRLGRKLVEPVRLKYGRIPGEALAPRVLFAVIRHGDFVAELDRPDPFVSTTVARASCPRILSCSVKWRKNWSSAMNCSFYRETQRTVSSFRFQVSRDSREPS